ncbi:MAG TPA: hypothetical protein VFF70_04200, partial [Anaerolineae bacterium]|nr:hypothetical protein [Anaerolineae bacterium]
MTTTSTTFTPPYPPSWVDRFIGWIDRLPVPAWLFYIVLLVAEFAALNILLWTIGTLPTGSFDLARTYSIVYSVGSIAWIHYLNRIASRAIKQFAPALGNDQNEYEAFRYRLTTLPKRTALIVTILNFILEIFSNLLIFAKGGSPAEVFTNLLISMISYGLTGVALYAIVRQLLLVSQIHAVASRVNLFERAPLYAFSGLTVRTGIASLIATYFAIAINPEAQISVGAILYNSVGLVLAAACFALPLNGMHQRMTKEKARLLARVDRRFETAFDKLHYGFDTEDFSQTDALNKSLTGLTIERDTIQKISTWPWQTGTFRGFSGALILPIIIWLITRL